ncbi:Apoptosis-inducing factor 2 [Triticum urartu]|uniref:Apoptosis-inducing factor 2 n=1 Tax=Triticum urartu TaxID=4572 RepID=M7ZG22_TRIUA|nr:Apoptosis-inducing factor 2 [Triticum urartu]
MNESKKRCDALKRRCDALKRRKEYLEIPWTNMRSKVEPSVAEKSLINHSDYLSGQVITASAADISGEAVIRTEGRLVEYTYLVIAAALEYLISFTFPDDVKIKYSDSILIVGGEPSGVELAAEIAVNYPDNKVTLVHDRPRLLESAGQKAGGKALLWLRSKNVEVYLEQSIDLESMSEGDRLYRTSSGIEITADCCFSCLDRPLSSSWIRGSELKDCLDNDGRLMVDVNLRVKGQLNIFAAGDIIDIPVG